MSDTIKLPVRKLKEVGNGWLLWTIYDNDNLFVCSCNSEVKADAIVAALNGEGRMRACLESLLPGEKRVKQTSVEHNLATGRIYLSVAGVVTIVEGDICRDPDYGHRNSAGTSVWSSEEIKAIEEKFSAPIRQALQESTP